MDRDTALSLFRFHLSPFPPETPDTQATVNTILNLSNNKVTNLRQTINEPVISWSVYKTRPRLVFPFFHKHFIVVVSIAVKHSFSCLN